MRVVHARMVGILSSQLAAHFMAPRARILSDSERNPGAAGIVNGIGHWANRKNKPQKARSVEVPIRGGIRNRFLLWRAPDNHD